MPNRDLDPFLVDQVTRRRYPEVSVGGQTVRGEPNVVTGIRAGIRPVAGELEATEYGVIPRGRVKITFDPEVDVVAGDELEATAGAYTGQRYQVLPIVAHRTAIPSVKVVAELLPQGA